VDTGSLPFETELNSTFCLP